MLSLLRLPRLTCWLAVLPFVLLSLIVPGTMLERDGDGVSVVLCADGAPVEMVLGPDGELREKTPHQAHRICDWAPHSQPLLGQAGMAAPAPTASLMPAEFAQARPERHRRAQVLAPMARGPPERI